MTAKAEEIEEGIYFLSGEGKGSHNYLIRASYRNVLIDSGLDQDFLYLQEQLLSLGLKVRDIDLVINTHEHLDHIGANRYFQESSFIAAHRFAATKITLEDHYVTLYRSGDLNKVPLRVHLWLENRFLFDLGSHTLEVIHTPGHTSGSICIYEFKTKVLFSGDTVFAGGTLSYIAESGSVGDYVNSIMRLEARKISKIFPGHGEISQSPEQDLSEAIINAKKLLRGE
ncbi:MAG: MBL fold metallo-hydrolase [Candidatus Aminicenantes bacterium]|nr:MBL fold metallo-hydrolase [Candidatus Aminicenantes bacterium]